MFICVTLFKTALIKYHGLITMPARQDVSVDYCRSFYFVLFIQHVKKVSQNIYFLFFITEKSTGKEE